MTLIRRLSKALVGAVCIGACNLPVLADGHEVASKVCRSCHGATGNEIKRIYPRLAGMNEAYTRKQLYDYLDGRRTDPLMDLALPTFKASDVPGIAAYYASQVPTAGKVLEPKMVAHGKKLYEEGNPASGLPNCQGCHGDKAQGVGDKYPRLAHQQQRYFTLQMTNYRKGVRSNDRAHAMRDIAALMTESEVAAVAEYLAGL